MTSFYGSLSLKLGLALTIFASLALSAPSAQRLVLRSPSDVMEHSIHRLYLPIELAPAALAGALSARARSTADEPDVPIDLLQKRTTSSAELLEPLEQEAALLSGMKRKMFWQPLGYMPASARAHHNGGNGGSNSRTASKDNGSNVFRYG